MATAKRPAKLKGVEIEERSARDRPLQDERDDVLDRVEFAKNLCKALVDSTTGAATGVTIAVTGPWGSGKSTILNFVETELARGSPPALVFRFDPWIFSGSQSLVRQFLEDLAKTLGGLAKSKTDRFTAAAKSVAEYALPFATLGNILMPGAGSAMGLALKEAAGVDRQPSLREMRAAAEKALSRLNAPIVAIIDDLDRLTDDEILEMCKLVRAVADFQNMSYVIAYDREHIAQALGKARNIAAARNYGADYLEKIVQIQIPLPATEPPELARLFDDGIRALVSRGVLPNGSDKHPLYEKTRDLILGVSDRCTPRDIARTTMMLVPILQLVGGEIFWVDLFGFAYLMSKHPEIVDAMRSKTDWFVDDPAVVTVEIIRVLEDRNSQDQKRRAVFFDGLSIPAEAVALVRHLFPALAERPQRLAEEPNRLSKRRCLRTALRLGLPPGMFSNAFVKELLVSPAGGVSATLEQCESSGTLVDLIDRVGETFSIRDVKHFADLSQEVAFWIELCAFLQRRTKEAPTLDRIRYAPLLDSIAQALFSRAQRKDHSPDLASFFWSLLERGDMGVVSAILRNEFHRHGLFEFEQNEARPSFMDKEQTIRLSEKFSREVTLLHMQGGLLPSSLTPGPYFLLSWMKSWKDEHRLELDRQLQDDRNLDDFVAIGWRPSSRLTSDGIARICDVNHFRARVEARLKQLKDLHDTSGLKSLYEQVSSW